jgi:transcription termination factor Rho
MLPVGVGLALIGLWLLFVAFSPRPMTAVALKAETGVFLRPRDLARLAVAVADDVDGVSDAHASATRNKVMVKVTTTGDDSVGEAVKAAVAQRLEPLVPNLRISVRTAGGAR